MEKSPSSPAGNSKEPAFMNYQSFGEELFESLLLPWVAPVSSLFHWTITRVEFSLWSVVGALSKVKRYFFTTPPETGMKHLDVGEAQQSFFKQLRKANILRDILCVPKEALEMVRVPLPKILCLDLISPTQTQWESSKLLTFPLQKYQHHKKKARWRATTLQEKLQQLLWDTSRLWNRKKPGMPK